MTTPSEGALSITPTGQILVTAGDLVIVIGMTADELRSMAELMEETADRLEDDAADAATAAIERARSLQ